MNIPIKTVQPENTQLLTLYELDDASVATQPNSSGWCSLDGRGLITASGEEAETFLQGQLTQDMALIKKGQTRLGAHCTPKGRILSLFRCCFWKDQFYLDLPSELEAPSLKRLSMYKLRTKVNLDAASTRVSRTALWGDAMRQALHNANWNVPDEPGESSYSDEGLLACLSKNRWFLISTLAYANTLRSQLSLLMPDNDQGWCIVSICAGEPEVLSPTMDTWIPQMLNLDQLQGVSFKKGCYTGQEIVARAHFLGRVKRRMHLFAYEGEVSPLPGQKLDLHQEEARRFSILSNISRDQPTDTEDESADSAHVVRSVETQSGKGWVLAVIKIPSNLEVPASEK